MDTMDIHSYSQDQCKINEEISFESFEDLYNNLSDLGGYHEKNVDRLVHLFRSNVLNKIKVIKRNQNG